MGSEAPFRAPHLSLREPRFVVAATRARVRRLQIRLELLLPGPLRPTRRRLRRFIRPDGSSVFVYQTWGVDRMVRVELANLLSGLDDVGVVSVDEPMRDSARTYARVGFAVRVGFGAAQYRGAPNVRVAPLGVPSNFVPPESPKPLRERSFSWAFLGEVKNESGRKMVEHLDAVGGECFLHATSAWESEDALGGAPYSDILADAVFAPSPPANVHVECYRTYEALECGADTRRRYRLLPHGVRGSVPGRAIGLERRARDPQRFPGGSSCARAARRADPALVGRCEADVSRQGPRAHPAISDEPLRPTFPGLW